VRLRAHSTGTYTHVRLYPSSSSAIAHMSERLDMYRLRHLVINELQDAVLGR
jgi:tRNA A37 threonylcarbamoyladenosine biosynthesis protein TsaE